MSRIMKAALFGAACLLLVGPGLAAQKIALRYASPFQTGHILVETGEKFREVMNRDGRGRFDVTVQPAAASEEAANELCSQGRVEMQATGGRPLEVSAPKYFFFNAPYVMKDFDHFMRVWDGPLGKQAREQVERQGSQIYLGIVYRGLRQMTSKKPVFSPDDVSGLKFRLPTVTTWIAVWKAMGAEPVPVPLPELYASLKTGRAEASEGDLPQIASFKLNEVQTHLTLTNHLVQTGGVLVNKGFFDKLSPADRDLVRKAMKEAVDWANAKMKSGETALLVDLQKKGMQVVVPDAESFRVKGKPAVEALFRKEWPVTTWAEVLAQ